MLSIWSIDTEEHEVIGKAATFKGAIQKCIDLVPCADNVSHGQDVLTVISVLQHDDGTGSVTIKTDTVSTDYGSDDPYEFWIGHS